MQKEIQILQEELAKTRDQIAKLQASLQEKPNYGIGQGDPAIVRWDLDQAILEQSKERATSLAQALTRLNTTSTSSNLAMFLTVIVLRSSLV